MTRIGRELYMRPKKYPYSRQRYQEFIVRETRLPFGEVFRTIGIKDIWTGNIVDFRREVSHK